MEPFHPIIAFQRDNEKSLYILNASAIRVKVDEFDFDLGYLHVPGYIDSEPWNPIGFTETENEFGIVYTVGSRDGLVDGRGRPMSVFAHYYLPAARVGNPLTPEDCSNLYDMAVEALKHSSEEAAKRTRGLSILSALIEPPEFMRSSLPLIEAEHGIEISRFWEPQTKSNK